MAELLDVEQQPEMELEEGETLGNLEEENPSDYESVEEPPEQQEEPEQDNPDRLPVGHMKNYWRWCASRIDE